MPARIDSPTVSDGCLMPPISMVPRVRRRDAAQDLHQRRFAGAVFADQTQDLAGKDLQVETGQCEYARDRICARRKAEARAPRPCGGTRRGIAERSVVSFIGAASLLKADGAAYTCRAALACVDCGISRRSWLSNRRRIRRHCPC